MAYFAKLGTGNIVENVISINNAVITDNNGVEQEHLGNDFINKLYNTRDVWKQTSYNRTFRKNYAGVGYYYDEDSDTFTSNNHKHFVTTSASSINEGSTSVNTPVDAFIAKGSASAFATRE